MGGTMSGGITRTALQIWGSPRHRASPRPRPSPHLRPAAPRPPAPPRVAAPPPPPTSWETSRSGETLSRVESQSHVRIHPGRTRTPRGRATKPRPRRTPPSHTIRVWLCARRAPRALPWHREVSRGGRSDASSALRPVSPDCLLVVSENARSRGGGGGGGGRGGGGSGEGGRSGDARDAGSSTGGEPSPQGSSVVYRGGEQHRQAGG